MNGPGHAEHASTMTGTRNTRHLAAVAIRADGRRVDVRLTGPSDTLLGKLDLVVLGLLALITGSRREPGGRRR
jgi:hypothetical protein